MLKETLSLKRFIYFILFFFYNPPLLAWGVLITPRVKTCAQVQSFSSSRSNIFSSCTFLEATPTDDRCSFYHFFRSSEDVKIFQRGAENTPRVIKEYFLTENTIKVSYIADLFYFYHNNN